VVKCFFPIRLCELDFAARRDSGNMLASQKNAAPTNDYATEN